MLWMDGKTDGKTDNVKIAYPTKTPFCRGYNNHGYPFTEANIIQMIIL